MMYEDLIKSLREDHGKQYYARDMEAADAIEELETACDQYEKNYKNLCEYLPKWIPVTERLPKYAGVYLCRIKSFNGDFRYTDTMKYVDGFFYERGVATDRITHWMPLPDDPPTVDTDKQP